MITKQFASLERAEAAIAKAQAEGRWCDSEPCKVLAPNRRDWVWAVSFE